MPLQSGHIFNDHTPELADKHPLAQLLLVLIAEYFWRESNAGKLFTILRHARQTGYCYLVSVKT